MLSSEQRDTSCWLSLQRVDEAFILRPKIREATTTTRLWSPIFPKLNRFVVILKRWLVAAQCGSHGNIFSQTEN